MPRMIRIDPDLNMARFYETGVQADLFGGAVLWRHWGRIGRPGRERRDWFATPRDARAAMAALIAAKHRRGYWAPNKAGQQE